MHGEHQTHSAGINKYGRQNNVMCLHQEAMLWALQRLQPLSIGTIHSTYTRRNNPMGGLRNLPSQPTHMTHQHVPAVQDTKWPQQDAPSKSVPFVRKANDMPCLTLFGVSCKKNKMRNDLRANTPPPKIDLTGVGCTPRRTRCTLCANVPLRCLAWIYRRPGNLTLRCIQV